MSLENLALYKLFLPFVKLIFAVAGWVASVLVQIVNPEELKRKELTYRLVTSGISIPVVMSLDSVYDFNKWFISVLTIFFGLFMWLVLDIAKKKLPSKLGKIIDKYGE